MIYTESAEMLKSDVRKELLGKLRGQDPSSREERSLRIQQNLISSRKFAESSTIMSYVSLYSEVDTGLLNRTVLEKGKRLVVPSIDKGNHVIVASELKSMDDLVMGPYGIHVPKVPLEVSLGEIDLVIVPGVAFDRKNMRLGRGKGYYDRFLARPELSLTKTVGFAFHFQVLDNLPSDPHDKPVSRVITDRSPADQRIF